MSNRRPLIAGNWKMNGLTKDGLALAGEIATRLNKVASPNCDVLVCPPMTLVAAIAQKAEGSKLSVGAQDCHMNETGAHTGDTSPVMIKDAGCEYVILGHSERRTDHKETNEVVKAKASAAIKAGLKAIICIGETEAERDANKTIDVCASQIKGSVPAESTAENTVIAYEPVWAIGTGRTPTTADVQEVHAEVRKALTEVIGAEAAKTRILYGGSVKPTNASEFMPLPDVDGALVGGASLKADDFWGIVDSCI